ncbi:hypothetical protein F5Y16DRAFT_393951 [Xylariaceae sp. FL0255]|nr:hypothetical protein F5Y16DRAFT_393951 [Xylariaceae sp. FL0255]
MELAAPTPATGIHKLPTDVIRCVCDQLDIQSLYKLTRVCRSLHAGLDFYIMNRLILWEKSKAPSTVDEWRDKPPRYQYRRHIPEDPVIVDAIRKNRDITTIERLVQACQQLCPSLLSDTFLPEQHWWRWWRDESPIYTAAVQNRIDVIELLVARGADLNIRFKLPDNQDDRYFDPRLYTPSHGSAHHLSNSGVPEEYYHHCCEGLLDIAIRCNNSPLAEYLLKRADFRVHVESLYYAAMIDSVAWFKTILACGKFSDQEATEVLARAFLSCGGSPMSEIWVDVILSFGLDPCKQWEYPQRAGQTWSMSPARVIDQLYGYYKITYWSCSSIIVLLKYFPPDPDPLEEMLRFCVKHDEYLDLNKYILTQLASPPKMWIEAYIEAIGGGYCLRSSVWDNTEIRDFLLDGLRSLSSKDLNQAVTHNDHSATLLEHTVRQTRAKTPFRYKRRKRNRRFNLVTQGTDRIFAACWEWIGPLIEMGAHGGVLEPDLRKSIEAGPDQALQSGSFLTDMLTREHIPTKLNCSIYHDKPNRYGDGDIQVEGGGRYPVP